jgi:hypothetical protein
MRTEAIQVRIVRVDTGEEVNLRDGNLLLRVSTDPEAAVVRCFVRHAGSRREVYLQSGLGIRDFVMDCLLDKDEKPQTPDPGS